MAKDDNSRSSNSLERQDVNSWKDGLISSFFAGRTPEKGLQEATNVVVDQNGTLRPRGSFEPSGIADLPYPILSNMFVYRTPTGNENLLCMLNKDGVGRVYILDEILQNTWVEIDNVDFQPVHSDFCQIAKRVAICNGEDNFSYLDTETNEIVRFEEVDDPTTPLTLTKNNLSGTVKFQIYYRYTYDGNGGDTNLSPTANVGIPLRREVWGDTDSITVTRTDTPDPDANSWSIWMVAITDGDGEPQIEDYGLLASGLPLTQNSYTDNGNVSVSGTAEAPEDNTTLGPKLWFCEVINGKIWGIGSGDAAHIVYHGGDLNFEFNFSNAHGGGFSPIDTGGREVPMAINLGRDNSGTTCINVLTNSTAGMGGIYDVKANTVNMDDDSVTGWEFLRREGNDGTNAPWSVLRANNNVYYLSLDGFKSTGVKPNIVGIQSTDIISNAIRDKSLNLSQSDLSDCVGIYWDEKILWSVAYGSQDNNQIWVYDILHGGIWTVWNCPTNAMFRWVSSDTQPVSVFIVQGQKILRYLPFSTTHSDGGQVFTSSVKSGLIKFKEDGREWVFLLQLLFILLRPRGRVNFEVTSYTRKGAVTKRATVDYNDRIGGAGLGGWGELDPTQALDGSWSKRDGWTWPGRSFQLGAMEWLEVLIKTKKLINRFDWRIWVDQPNSTYMLSQAVPEFTDVGVGPDFTSRAGVDKI